MTDLTDEEYKKIAASFRDEIKALCKTYNVEHIQMTASIHDNDHVIQIFKPAYPWVWYRLCNMHSEEQDKIHQKMNEIVTDKLQHALKTDRIKSADENVIKEILRKLANY